MAFYYNCFASGSATTAADPKYIRWVLYPDSVTGAKLFAACSSAFHYIVDPPKLIEVTCVATAHSQPKRRRQS